MASITDVGIDLRGERQLHQDAVDVAPLVQRAHDAQKLLLRRLGGQLDALREDAHFGARLAFAAHVAGRGRIVADEHGRQSRRETVAALKRRHLLLDLPSQRLRRREAVDDLAHAAAILNALWVVNPPWRNAATTAHSRLEPLNPRTLQFTVRPHDHRHSEGDQSGRKPRGDHAGRRERVGRARASGAHRAARRRRQRPCRCAVPRRRRAGAAHRAAGVAATPR